MSVAPISMDISLLPEELFEEIIFYLNLEDVLSCCLVSRSWRNAINTDRIWFNLCSKITKLKKNEFKLIEAPCKVDPVFTTPSQKCSCLSEVCSWRVRYMQEAHISRNWRLGRFFASPITRPLFPLGVECDEDVLIVASMENWEFKVWSLSSTPKLLQVSRFSLWQVFADFFKLSGNKLVVGQCTLVQVYTIDKSHDSTFELAHRFLFNKSEEESYNIPNSPDVSDWYNNNIGLYRSDIICNYDHNGDYFVGVMIEGNLKMAILHIWDINSGHKVADQKIPTIDGLITDLNCYIRFSNMFILIQHTDRAQERTTVCCFSLTTFEYTSFRISFEYVVPIFLFGDKFVANIDSTGKTLYLWKGEDGRFVDKVSCDFDILPATLQFLPSLIFLAGNNRSECYGTVKAFDTDQFKIICEFNTDYRITNLLYVRSSLVIVCGWMQIGLWDITTSSKVQSFCFGDCVWTNACNTKMVVENDDELCLLDFW